MRLATAEINLTALAHNLAQVKRFAPNSKVMAVLKANAYGHGLVKIAQHLNDADAFAVARIDEALALRAGGLTKPIVLLEGFFNKDDLPILLANNFQTIIHDGYQLAALEEAELEAPLLCWLKVNTGMHRLGIAPEQFDEFYKRLQKTPNANNTVNLMTHFACADDVNNTKTAPRHAKEGTPVVIGKQRYGIVGSVAMDMISVDIGQNEHNIKVGDRVTMWGPELPVEEIAQCADTIPYELLCNITPRVSYEYQP